MLPRDTSCMVYQGLGCFLWGIINIRGFIPQNTGTIQNFNFHFPFCTSGERDFFVSTLVQPFTFPSLRFEYSASVLEIRCQPGSQKRELFVGFPYSRKAKRFLILVDDQREDKLRFLSLRCLNTGRLFVNKKFRERSLDTRRMAILKNCKFKSIARLIQTIQFNVQRIGYNLVWVYGFICNILNLKCRKVQKT